MFRTRTLCTLLVCALAGSAQAGEDTPTPPTEPPAPRLTPGVARWYDPSLPPPKEAPSGDAGAEEDPELAGAVEEEVVEEGGVEETGGTSTEPPAGGGATKPPPSGSETRGAFTGVRGKVVDGKTGEGLIEAQVKVVKGGEGSAVTEVDGSFELELAPGTYELRVFTALYKGQRLRVTVAAGRAQPLTVKLVPEDDTTDEVVVEAKVEKRNEAAVLQVRKKAVTVSDVLSAQEISKTPDSNAGDAVKRVVSVTIVDGKYVVLRGLEGRYVQTLLNGVTLPSPEPDRNAVPLDLFPASLLANLTVIKSYSAELPGQFGGGELLIETNSYPDDFELKVSASTSANTDTTFQAGLVNPATTGATSFFGFDDGSRRLPRPVPTNAAVRDLPNELTEQIGESFDNRWVPTEEDAAPNLSLGLTVGDTRRLGGGKKLGYLGTASLRKGFGARETVIRTLFQNNGAFEFQNDQTQTLGEAETSVGGLANVGLELSPRSSLQAFGLYTHVGEDTSSFATGVVGSDRIKTDRWRLSFVERQLAFGQLTGSHRLSPALDSKWQVNAASTRRDELDSRDVGYTYGDSATESSYIDQPGSGQRFFSFLDDLAYGASGDLTWESSRVKVRGGVFAQASARELASRRFRFHVSRSGDQAVLRQGPEMLFSAENIGPNLYLQEDTKQEDSYQADLLIAGAHASVEVSVTEPLRAIAGVRIEHATQSLDSGSAFGLPGEKASLERTNDDVFPAANLVYALTTQMNLRGAYSYTLVRPRFRELAPFLFYDYVRGRSVAGNVGLVDTHIHNADLRWEYFPGEAEVLAASVFYKHFADPIEQVITNTGNDAQFKNAPAGTMVGAELELRVGLGRWSKPLRDVKLGSNLALIRSEIDLGDDKGQLTNAKRAMFGQSPYVVNVSAGYANDRRGELTLLYNVIGPRISDVGIYPFPDIREQAFHRIDLVAARKLREGLKLKASVANLLNQRVELTQGDLVVAGYSPGVSFSLGLDWNP